MDPKTKFNLKIFLYYLFVEPITDEFRMPNLRTLLWAPVFVFAYFRLNYFLFGTLIIEAILYMIHDYQSGKYMHWYRERKYADMRKALKKVRAEKKEKENQEQKLSKI